MTDDRHLTPVARTPGSAAPQPPAVEALLGQQGWGWGEPHPGDAGDRSTSPTERPDPDGGA